MVSDSVLRNTDFFTSTVYSTKTNRRMVNEAALHARRMGEYEFKYGRKVVEEFRDAVCSIEEHVDPNFFIRKQREDQDKEDDKRPSRREGRYDDLLSREEREAHSGGIDSREDVRKHKPSLEVPEKDLVYFIMKQSPS